MRRPVVTVTRPRTWLHTSLPDPGGVAIGGAAGRKEGGHACIGPSSKRRIPAGAAPDRRRHRDIGGPATVRRASPGVRPTAHGEAMSAASLTTATVPRCRAASAVHVVQAGRRRADVYGTVVTVTRQRTCTTRLQMRCRGESGVKERRAPRLQQSTAARRAPDTIAPTVTTGHACLDVRRASPSACADGHVQ